MVHPENRSVHITAQAGNIAQTACDAIIVNLFEGVTQPGGGTGAVDKALEGSIGETLRSNTAFTGKLGETLVLPTYGKIPARYVVIVGLGKAEEMNSLTLRRSSAAAIKACLKLKIRTAASLIHGAGIGGYDALSSARLVAEGIVLGSYQFLTWKTLKPEEQPTLSEVLIIEQDESKLSKIKEGVAIGQRIAEGVNKARNWVFDSANHITPGYLVQMAQAIPGLDCQVLEKSDMERLGMGAFLNVAKGSDENPYLIHLSYKPDKPRQPLKKITLVGKGITFDSGGLSLKPPVSQETMKMDMGGAAAVLATMDTIAELRGLDVQVDAFIPTCENMPSGHAGRPGDIIRAMNGKTIEVNNTDAEGRLILCDALTYAQQTVDPDEIIDLATLTGACIIALGKVAAGLMGTDDNLINNLKAAGEHAGEKLWQLPLYDEYKAFLKSDVADLINAGAKGEAGSSAAGIFLKEFIDPERAWVHIDIAGPAYLDKAKETPETPAGATGFGVRTLLYYLYQL